jgi:hypothetical protein
VLIDGQVRMQVHLRPASARDDHRRDRAPPSPRESARPLRPLVPRYRHDERLRTPHMPIDDLVGRRDQLIPTKPQLRTMAGAVGAGFSLRYSARMRACTMAHRSQAFSQRTLPDRTRSTRPPTVKDEARFGAM